HIGAPPAPEGAELGSAVRCAVSGRRIPSISAGSIAASCLGAAFVLATYLHSPAQSPRSEAVKRIVIRTLLCVSVVVVALPTAGGGVLDARVYPPFAFAPCNVRVQAFIEPDARNRSIEFVLDSESLYTSSTAELDGDRAPRTKEVMFRNLPAGTY